jgi:hypothetical protein
MYEQLRFPRGGPKRQFLVQAGRPHPLAPPVPARALPFAVGLTFPLCSHSH